MDAGRDPSAIPFAVTRTGGAGLTRAMTRSARFEAPARGVRVPAGQGREVEGRIGAAVVGSAEDGVLTDVAAAHTLGLPLPPWLREIPDISVAVTPGRARPRRPDVRGRRLRLPTDHVTCFQGRAVTCAARTWLDCAAFIPLEYVVAMGDAILHRGQATERDLARMAHWGYRRRGVAVARRALLLLDSRAESPGESVVRVHLVLAGLPRPVCNLDIVVDGGWLARGDITWPDFRLVLEYDGLVHLQETRRRSDARRRNLLQEAGWLVITATADDLRRPWLMVGQVRSALLSRGWDGKTPRNVTR